MIAGDVVLFEGHHLIDRLIRTAQRRRFPPDLARWTHCAVALNDWAIVEAIGGGVRMREFIPDKEPDTFQIVPTHASREQRDACSRFLLSCVGKPYGTLTAASAGLALLTGGKLALFIDGTDICSGLAAEALCRLGYIFPDEPVSMTPADLAQVLLGPARTAAPTSGAPH